MDTSEKYNAKNDSAKNDKPDSKPSAFMLLNLTTIGEAKPRETRQIINVDNIARFDLETRVLTTMESVSLPSNADCTVQQTFLVSPEDVAKFEQLVKQDLESEEDTNG